MAKRKKTPEEKEHHALVGDMRDLLRLKHGRNVIYHFLGLCNLYGDVFTGNSQTFFLEGKRSIGLDILQLMEEADPTAYPRLLLEKIEPPETGEENAS